MPIEIIERDNLSEDELEWLGLIEDYPGDWNEEMIRSATFKDLPEEVVDYLVKVWLNLA
jgi:hypothetical protein|tara:strand:+ start:329 stop:505 length:177 start_codon:yes stop_codon:yes gene_type:complete